MHVFPVIPVLTQEQRDIETNLDEFGARYFSSQYGRWMSPDWSANLEPIPYANMGNPQSLNLYAYVNNDPITEEDADGHERFDNTPIGGDGSRISITRELHI